MSLQGEIVVPPVYNNAYAVDKNCFVVEKRNENHDVVSALTDSEGNVIYVGNTAGTTGALASIGVPFNLGIQAAFAEYNKSGGFNGKTVELKHYDDKGNDNDGNAVLYHFSLFIS